MDHSLTHTLSPTLTLSLTSIRRRLGWPRQYTGYRRGRNVPARPPCRVPLDSRSRVQGATATAGVRVQGATATAGVRVQGATATAGVRVQGATATAGVRVQGATANQGLGYRVPQPQLGLGCLGKDHVLPIRVRVTVRSCLGKNRVWPIRVRVRTIVLSVDPGIKLGLGLGPALARTVYGQLGLGLGLGLGPALARIMYRHRASTAMQMMPQKPLTYMYLQMMTVNVTLRLRCRFIVGWAEC